MQNNEQLNERVKEIKQSFRLMMDGVASQSMRDKGLNYHVNWGASLPMLKQKAAELGKDYDTRHAANACRQDTIRSGGYMDGTDHLAGDSRARIL